MSDRKTRCLIVDDEPIAIRVIAAHLEKIPDVEVAATCKNAIEAYERIPVGDIDLVFLDIDMPELSGVDLVRSLETPPPFIFTTAHREFAVEGFELDAVDYLLKPISLPRLLKALDRYRRLQVEADSRPGSASRSGPERENRFITLRSNRENINVRIDDILFIESLSDYTKFHTTSRTLVTKRKISHLAEELSTDGFIRIHRSFLVPLARISTYTGDTVTIEDKALPIGRSYKQSVMDRLES